MYIPLLKYLFSNKTTSVRDNAVVILLKPREPAYWVEKNQQELDAFVEKGRALLQARGRAAADEEEANAECLEFSNYERLQK